MDSLKKLHLQSPRSAFKKLSQYEDDTPQELQTRSLRKRKSASTSENKPVLKKG